MNWREDESSIPAYKTVNTRQATPLPTPKESLTGLLRASDNITSPHHGGKLNLRYEFTVRLIFKKYLD